MDIRNFCYFFCFGFSFSFFLFVFLGLVCLFPSEFGCRLSPPLACKRCQSNRGKGQPNLKNYKPKIQSQVTNVQIKATHSYFINPSFDKKRNRLILNTLPLAYKFSFYDPIEFRSTQKQILLLYAIQSISHLPLKK